MAIETQNLVVQTWIQNQTQNPQTFQREICDRDEMYLFALNNAQGNSEQACIRYYTNGRRIWDSVQQIVTWHFQQWENVSSFLDFASGYGRFTRFLIQALPPAKIWISDIYSEAVQFQTQQFGVQGIFSTTHPKDYRVEQQFDCILASSFFSHIPHKTFTVWFQKLYELLSPTGILIFSVHDISLAPSSVEQNQFYFVPESESQSLDQQEYGTTYVSEAFIQEVLQLVTPGQAVYHRIPKGLCGHQDLYLVSKDSTLDFSTLAFSYHPEGQLESWKLTETGAIQLQGWVTDPTPNGGISEIQLWRNHECIQRCSPVPESSETSKLNWCFSVNQTQILPEDVIWVKAVNRQKLERILQINQKRDFWNQISREMAVNCNQAVFSIIGMHRSGTSLTASLLQDVGVCLGDHLVGEDVGNEKGHYEDLDFVEFHKKLLRSQSLDLDGLTGESEITILERYHEMAQKILNEKTKRSLWGWKDPRTTLFLDFWLNLLPETRFILVFRSPWEVVDSLYRRGSDELIEAYPEKAVDLWMHYNQKMLEFYDQHPEKCLLVNLSKVVESPPAFIDAINHKFNLSLPDPASDIIDLSLLGSEISKSHRPRFMQEYFPEAVNLYRELNQKAAPFQEDWGKIEAKLTPPYSAKDTGIRDWIELGRLKRAHKQQKAEFLKVNQQTQAELQRTQTELLQTQSQMREIHAEAVQINDKLIEAYGQLQQNQPELDEMRSQLEQAQAQIQQAHGIIAAMKSSKFWKMRTLWLHLKQLVGAKIKEDVE